MISMHNRLKALFGAQFNPFTSDIPVDKCYISCEVQAFIIRVEEISSSGGYAMLTGMSGIGKSTTLRTIAYKLEESSKLIPAIISRPQSGLRDFYRELGTIFGVDLNTSNRFGSFKDMRGKWQKLIKDTCFRPVLIIDEAQSAREEVLSELRLLGSIELDSQCLTAVILAGDERLSEKLQSPELLPLASRMREKLILRPYPQNELEKMLAHVLEQANCSQMLSSGVRMLLTEHSCGNPRTMMNRAEQLLSAALREEISVIDEKTYHRVFSITSPSKKGIR